MAEPVELVDVVETDRLTGNERLLWLTQGVSRGEAETRIKWLTENITNRYGYRLVESGSWDPDA